jgi:hypothetical protein
VQGAPQQAALKLGSRRSHTHTTPPLPRMACPHRLALGDGLCDGLGDSVGGSCAAAGSSQGQGIGHGRSISLYNARAESSNTAQAVDAVHFGRHSAGARVSHLTTNSQVTCKRSLQQPESAHSPSCI